MNTFLIINPGSTSTKIACYQETKEIWTENIIHSTAELAVFSNIIAQLPYRIIAINTILEKKSFNWSKITCIMARGGLLKPIPSGIYRINEQMIYDLHQATYHHACNLAALIANYYHQKYPHLECFIADPVVVDELCDEARYTGHPHFTRRSFFHALNQKAIARLYAEDQQLIYENLNLIVAHLGGGISIGLHQKGYVIDTNQALDGEGPMAPERSGTLPAGDLIRMAYSKQYTAEEMLKMLAGKGGLMAYLGENDMRIIEKNIEAQDIKAKQVVAAMIYQIAKTIGGLATIVEGEIDAILLTGGLAYSEYLTGKLIPKIAFIAPVAIYAGENEMWALADNATRYYKGKIQEKKYK